MELNQGKVKNNDYPLQVFRGEVFYEPQFVPLYQRLSLITLTFLWRSGVINLKRASCPSFSHGPGLIVCK